LLNKLESNNIDKKEYDTLINEHFDKNIAVKKYFDIYNKLVDEI
jgi:hypothetical protein